MTEPFRMKITRIPHTPDPEKALRAWKVGVIKTVQRHFNKHGISQLEILKAVDEIRDAAYRLGTK